MAVERHQSGVLGKLRRIGESSGDETGSGLEDCRDSVSFPYSPQQEIRYATTSNQFNDSRSRCSVKFRFILRFACLGVSKTPTKQAFNREKKRALMENQDAFAAQAEAMAVRMRKQAAASLQKVAHRAA